MRLSIHHHLGLGDHLDCNGMVRFFLDQGGYDTVFVFSKIRYFDMIKYMYRDEDRIKVIKIDEKKDELVQVRNFVKATKPEFSLRVGFENYPTGQEELLDKNCWELFYEQMLVPYNVRVDCFGFDRDLKEEKRVLKKLNPEGKPFIFLHEDVFRGFTIDRSKIDSDLVIIENDVTENIFHFIKILEEAEEIHCMESSFKSLIDIYAKTDKIFYHDFRNQPLGKHTNKEWNIVSYG